MIELTQNDTAGRLLVTLNELVTLSDPFFFFVFTHVETRKVINVTVDPATDQSAWPDRFNQFPINVSNYFSDAPTGEYRYEVFERQNADNPIGQNLIESGKMRLEPAQDFAYSSYNPDTSYTAYNG